MTEWVLVPREPTEAMLGRLWLEIGDHPSKAHALDAYRAMLDAAPAAPQQAEPVAWMAFGGALVHAVTRNAMDPIEAERFDVPLYLHPPAAEVQRLRDAARAVLQEYSAHGGLRPSSMNPLIIDLHRAMEGKQC